MIALSIVDHEEGLFPFQLMAIDQPFTTERRRRFEVLAERQFGITEWNSFTVRRRVDLMIALLEQHEKNILAGVWELLRLNPVVLSVAVNTDIPGSQRWTNLGSSIQELKRSRLPQSWRMSGQRLSPASANFLERFFEENEIKASAKKARISSRPIASDSDHSLVSASRRQTITETMRRSQIDMKRQSGHSKSSHSTEGSLEDPFATGTPASLPPLATKTVSATPQSELIRHGAAKAPSTRDSLQRLPVEVSNPRALLETSSLSLDTFAESDGVIDSVDHSALYHPRRKDIVLIQHGSAYVVRRHTVLTPGSKSNSSRKGYWAELLKQMSEEASLNDLCTIRHGQVQDVVSSALIEGTVVLIDEDDTYLWIICGKDSCCAVENYDVDAAYSAISSFLDVKTGVWLEEIVHPHWTELSNEEDSHRIIDWVLSSFEKPVQVPSSTRFMIPHSILRASFANPSMNARQSIETSTRKLCFDVAKLKMQQMWPRREFIGVRYFVARRVCFQRQRFKFKKQERTIKFMKLLKKKQRRARKLAVELTTADESNAGKMPSRMLLDTSQKPNTNPTAESTGQRARTVPGAKPATTYKEETPVSPATPFKPKEGIQKPQSPVAATLLNARSKRGTKHADHGRARVLGVSSMQASMNMEELYEVRSLSRNPTAVTAKHVGLNPNQHAVSKKSPVEERHKHPWEGANSYQSNLKQRYEVEDGSMNISELFGGSLPPGSNHRSAPNVSIERDRVNKHSGDDGEYHGSFERKQRPEHQKNGVSANGNQSPKPGQEESLSPRQQARRWRSSLRRLNAQKAT